MFGGTNVVWLRQEGYLSFRGGCGATTLISSALWERSMRYSSLVPLRRLPCPAYNRWPWPLPMQPSVVEDPWVRTFGARVLTFGARPFVDSPLRTETSGYSCCCGSPGP